MHGFPFVPLTLVGLIVLGGYAALAGHGSPFIHNTPPALSAASLRKESPCAKRLLIKRVDGGHLVTDNDVKHAEAVCEQAAALESEH